MLVWELVYVKNHKLETRYFFTQEEAIKFARKQIKPTAWGTVFNPKAGDKVTFYFKGETIAKAILKEI